MKKMLALLLTLMLSLSVCAALADVPSGVEDGVLTIAMECAYAPYNWTQSDDSNGAVPISNVPGSYANGYDVMIAKKICEANGWQLEVIQSDWDSLVPGVQTGNFDAVIATPPMMAKVGRLGRILGPRGLMPNPKLGTVTMDVANMVGELKAGRVEYRADRYGICHVPIGKVSFETEKLVENYAALYGEILRVKPSTAKGRYVKSIAFSSTMGPGVKVDSSVTRNFMEA